MRTPNHNPVEPAVPSVETITLPLSIMTKEVKAALTQTAKDKVEKTRPAKTHYETRSKEANNSSDNEAGRKMALDNIHTSDPKLYHGYQEHHYSTKMHPILTTGVSPKVTIPRSLITPTIQTALEAELDRIAQIEIPAHPWHEQARERLAAMTPWEVKMDWSPKKEEEPTA